MNHPDPIDFELLWSEAGPIVAEALDYVQLHLPWLCRDAYVARSARPHNILRVQQGSFEYIFDHYTQLEENGTIPCDDSQEGRLIVALGRSAPSARQRDDYRLRGWIGPTNTAIGREWDKGHYIGHTLGGAVEGVEANVFIQRRDLNRGWSEDGKRFRRMEKYCVDNPGTLCFARPIYADGSSRAAWLEFGVVKSDGQLWVECFDNRLSGKATP